MGLFKRDEQHIEQAVAEKQPDLERAVQSARDALRQVEATLGEHDVNHAHLLRELENSTASLDAATLADDQRQIEVLCRARWEVQERLESLGRVRPHRLNQVEQARQTLYHGERAAADEEQRTIIAQKELLNRQIIEAVEGLGNLIAKAERAQTDIDTLAQQWNLSRPRARWLIPSGFILSKPGEALRVALDLKMAYGATMDLSRITSDAAALDALIEQQVTEEEILAALVEEVAHV
jgi:hypothetical protein